LAGHPGHLRSLFHPDLDIDPEVSHTALDYDVERIKYQTLPAIPSSRWHSKLT
jgi:hypothetical protein